MQAAESKTGVPVMGRAHECARLADVSPRTITRLCENGTLQAVKIGRVWRIHMPSFLEYLGIDPEEVSANA